MKRLGFFPLLGLLFLYACANPQALTGGKRDNQAPRLDSLRYSTPNKSTNFKEKEIILTFDEWVQLDASKVLISPPLSQKADIKLKHKSLIIRFKEPLKDATTYTINISDAVKDFTEGNPVKNMQFVFSTGDFLDSLEVKGQVVDAQTTQGKNNVLLALYENLQDSTPALEKPFYCSKTDEQGNFSIQNIRAGSFKVLAISDKNNNLMLDAGEEIGFLPEPITVTDSSKIMLKLPLFPPQGQVRAQSSRFLHRFAAKISFNQPLPAGSQIQLISNNASVLSQQLQADSAMIFLQHSLQNSAQLSFLVSYPNQPKTDTVNLSFFPALDSLPKLALVEIAQKSGKGLKKADNKHNPKKPFALNFNLPVETLDTSLVRLYVDSSSQPQPFNLMVENSRLYQLNTNWQAVDYKLVILPNAFKTVFATSNKDTIFKKISVAKAEDFGNLNLKLIHLDSSQNLSYILQLIRNKDEIYSSQSLSTEGKSSLDIVFPNLETGAYTVRIITDSNQNGRWDTGDYWQKRQPEPIFNGKPTNIRANWDNELELDLNPPIKGKTKKK